MKVSGKRVREMRERLALSAENASARASVSPHTWARAERGDEIRPSSVRRIATAFGTDPEQLMDLGESALSGKVQAAPEARTPITGKRLADATVSLNTPWGPDEKDEKIAELKARAEELEAENERLKKVLKSGLVEKMVAAEPGDRTDGGRRMAYCRGCGWWLVAEAQEIMEAWGRGEGSA